VSACFAYYINLEKPNIGLEHIDDKCVATIEKHLLPPPLPGSSNLALSQYNYVDKTEMFAYILSEKGTFFFSFCETLLLIRVVFKNEIHWLFSASKFIFAPSMRRIGKSVAVNMLAAMASGDRNIFNGYAVNNPGSSFNIGATIYSVIKLDFSGVIDSKIPLDTPKKVEKAVVATKRKFTEYLIRKAMEQHGIKIKPTFDHDAGVALDCWLVELEKKEGRKIVLLIDEYDDPITQFLPKHPEFAQDVADIMKPFYLTIKKSDPFFHKVFVTGVSKFSSTSMFSGANMFCPIMEEKVYFANLYGFTEQEIRDTYGSFIEDKFNDRSLDDVIADMRKMYDGYRVHPKQLDKDKFFNPWDVLKYFEEGELDPFWTKSCSSSVIDMLGLHGLGILAGFKIDNQRLFAPIAASEVPTHWQQAAFQTGYATIKEASHIQDNIYELTIGVPNQEVRKFLEGEFVNYLVGQVGLDLLESYKKSLLELNFTKVGQYLGEIIKKLPPKDVPPNEASFQALVLNLQLDERFRVTHEVGSRLPGDKAVGDMKRADGMVVFNKSGMSDGQLQIVVFEMKYESTALVALQQIIDKSYAKRALDFYRSNNAIQGEFMVYMVGVNMNRGGTVDLKHEVWSQTVG